MPGIVVGLMLGLMGFAWFMQKPVGHGQERLWHETKSTVLSTDTAKSQAVVVDSVDVPPVVCKPVETDEKKPIIRNLTGSFEQRQYILEPGEKCTPE